MNVKPVSNVADAVVIGGCTLFSLADIENTLSIVILVINIVYILVKGGFSIYQKMKDKKYSEVVNQLKETEEELKIFRDTIKGGDVDERKQD